MKRSVSILLRAAFAFSCVALLAFAAWQASLRGRADLTAQGPTAQVERWARSGRVDSLQRWRRAVDGLRAAQALVPGEAAVYASLARAYSLAAISAPTPSAASVYREFSLLHWRLVTMHRPTWPYGWSGIATHTFNLGYADVMGALSRAMRYGPWEPGVQLLASRVGLLRWELLDSTQREEVRQNWRRTAQRQGEALARMAVELKREPILCAEGLPGMQKRLQCDKRRNAAPRKRAGNRMTR